MINARHSPHVSRRTRQLPVLQQSAALCYRVREEQPEVLLITTRKSRRWIIPKGWPIDGLTLSQSAQQEAWEEAGVRGACGSHAVGQYYYEKHHRKKGRVMCAVNVFALLVETAEIHFPECEQRQRQWFSPEMAAFLVNPPELAVLLRKVGSVRH